MEDICTPKKINSRTDNVLHIPPSPFMKKIGFGTGVVVYELQRSPLPGKFRSPWAVKKLNQTINQKNYTHVINKRLKDEADILKKLNHPNIVGFRAFARDSDGINILAMEECTSSLGDLIENRVDLLGDLPYDALTILKVSHDVSKALKYLHDDMLLLHCDVKSFNVLVKGQFEICKLCDFGVSLPLTKLGEVDKSKIGDEIEYPGTPCWSPPEIFKIDQEITTKADIFSFGLVIWEMIALSPPVQEEAEAVEKLESAEEDAAEKLESAESFTDFKRTRRPDLPDVELDSEYNLVLEMYFCSTDVDLKKRPNACDLVGVLDEFFRLPSRNCT